MNDPYAEVLPWRVGRKVGRTIYRQISTEPADGDALIGVMDTRWLARQAVTAYNQRFALLVALDALVAATRTEINGYVAGMMLESPVGEMNRAGAQVLRQWTDKLAAAIATHREPKP